MVDNRDVLVQNRRILLTNLSKQLWPQYTKAQFVEYYTLAAPYLLPYLADRPITLVRYPDGITGKSFYQKDKPPRTPGWVRTYPTWSSEKDRPLEYLLVNDLPTLVWIANLAAIELNPWHSRYTTPDNPDWAVIDLDPAEPDGFPTARKVALLCKDLLDHLGCTGYPKLSGATGIHIYLRLPASFSYHNSTTLIGFIGKLLQHLAPHLITLERQIKKRTGKVYVDHLQNLKNKTIVAPYSLRPLPQAPISMPITWSEVATVFPEDFTLANFSRQISRLPQDPFRKLLAPLSKEEEANIRHLSVMASRSKHCQH